MSKRGKPPETPKAKKPEKKKAPAKKAPANDLAVFDAETKRSQLRIAKARDKISKALDDPEMRAQIVAAMRRMINEGKS